MKIGSRLSGGFEGFSDADGRSKARFKTAADIKKELKRLGY
ncbi:hypothetical protein [Niabella beijingensis]|nr:hypothetical protein [Niabella beijingensis]